MKLQEIAHSGLRWINITEPDQDMAAYLGKNFGFHGLDLEDVLTKYQFPKVDEYEKYLFIILQFPVYDPNRRLFVRAELDIFFGRDYLITINSGLLRDVGAFFEKCRTDEQSRNKYMSRGGAMLLYEIADALFTNVFPIINDEFQQIFELEENVFERSELKDMIEDIMVLKRNLINVRRIILPQRAILATLEQKHKKFIPEEMNIYFGDTVDKIDKILNQVETASAYAQILEDANENLISRSTNQVIKTLTIFSVILLPLTLLTSYYGMNTALPFEQDPHITSYINGALVFLVIMMLAIFAKKRWL